MLRFPASRVEKNHFKRLSQDHEKTELGDPGHTKLNEVIRMSPYHLLEYGVAEKF